ncbi:conserved hypothetical protein [Mesorhizobium sp. ORS 3359]|nr:conserved hypothetical protein [Mesorhizobium sp. ORS 3359]
MAGGVDGEVPLPSAVDPPAAQEKALTKAKRRKGWRSRRREMIFGQFGEAYHHAVHRQPRCRCCHLFIRCRQYKSCI